MIQYVLVLTSRHVLLSLYMFSILVYHTNYILTIGKSQNDSVDQLLSTWPLIATKIDICVCSQYIVKTAFSLAETKLGEKIYFHRNLFNELKATHSAIP